MALMITKRVWNVNLQPFLDNNFFLNLKSQYKKCGKMWNGTNMERFGDLKKFLNVFLYIWSQEVSEIQKKSIIMSWKKKIIENRFLMTFGYSCLILFIMSCQGIKASNEIIKINCFSSINAFSYEKYKFK